MKGSIGIGRLFGIQIRMHWTFLVVVFLFLASPGLPLAALILLFGSVLLHELGHSLVAKRFGIRVLDITFWPLGGMARMTEMPEQPKVEGLVAIAGPAVNFALALLSLPLLALALFLGQPFLFQAVLSFVLINLVLGTFNLLPAFPMDGGRILRAYLARSNDYVAATEKAVRAGRAVALAMVVASLVAAVVFELVLCVLPLIALFVWFAGGRELVAVRVRHGLSPFGRAATAGPGPVGWSAPAPGPPEPLASPAPDPRRPEARQRRPSGGFSEEDLRDLERFRGRLRRFRREE